MKSTATGKREVAVRYGGIKLSEGRQQGAQGRAKVRKDVAVLERQDRLGNKEKEAKGRGCRWEDSCSCKGERRQCWNQDLGSTLPTLLPHLCNVP